MSSPARIPWPKGRLSELGDLCSRLFFRDYFLVLIEDKLYEFAVFFHFAAQAFGIVAVYLRYTSFRRYLAGSAERVVFVGVVAVLQQIACVIVAIVFHLSVDDLTCQSVVDIVNILLLDVFRRSGQPIPRLVVAESLRIGRIFSLL